MYCAKATGDEINLATKVFLFGILMNPGKKVFQTKPPDKGSFPLDHDGECKEFMMKYMKCLQENNNSNSKCRGESKRYLECRMDRELMAKEDFEFLGYKNEQEK